MVLNQREDRSGEKRKIEVGNSLIEQSAHTKLLGIQIPGVPEMGHKSSNLYPTYLKGYEAT